MWLREDDGTLSPLASAEFVPAMGVFLCIRGDGSAVLAAAEDILSDLTQGD